jgi:hypothetical protein
MTTRGLIGADTESGIRAVFLKCDADDGLTDLRELAARHGVDKVAITLLETGQSWYGINWTPMPEHLEAGRFRPEAYEIVPDFGVKFAQSPCRYFTTTNRIPWDCEWVWIIQADGKTVKWVHKGVTKGDRTWRTQHWQESPLLPQ